MTTAVILAFLLLLCVFVAGFVRRLLLTSVRIWACDSPRSIILVPRGSQENLRSHQEDSRMAKKQKEKQGGPKPPVTHWSKWTKKFWEGDARPSKDYFALGEVPQKRGPYTKRAISN